MRLRRWLTPLALLVLAIAPACDGTGILPEWCAGPGNCDQETEYCDNECDLGECRTRPTACPTVMDPVCACDGRTYDNECLANKAGTDVASRGPCR